MTRTVAKSLAWAADGAAHLRGMMMRMGDDAFAAPSTLPDWTRAHVLTHVARNADAMVNLLDWARTGTPTPAYAAASSATPTSRPGRSARLPRSGRRRRLVGQAGRRGAGHAGAGVDGAVTSPKGEPMPAAESCGGGRARSGSTPSTSTPGRPSPTCPARCSTSCSPTSRGPSRRRPDFPPLLLGPTDEPRTWAVGEGGVEAATEVRGPVAELAAWLVGRSKGRDLRTAEGKRPPPRLPDWI